MGLEFGKSRPAGGNILERADLPELLAYQFTVSVAQHLNHERVHVRDLPAPKIENQNAILGGFKKAPVAALGSTQRIQCLFVAALRELVRQDVHLLAFDCWRGPARLLPGLTVSGPATDPRWIGRLSRSEEH